MYDTMPLLKPLVRNLKQWEAERAAEKAATDAKTKYASRLTEIANHTETAEDAAFILNAHIADKLGKRNDITAKEMMSALAKHSPPM